MADVNARLKRALDGAAPQHKVPGQEAFQLTEGTDGQLHVRDQDVKAELAEIKRTQADILARLDGTINTKVTGSIVEYYDITEDVGTVGAGTSKLVDINLGAKEGEYLYASVWFRRGSGEIEKIRIQYRSEASNRVQGAHTVDMPLLDTSVKERAGITEKIGLLTNRISLEVTARPDVDFRGMGIGLYLWKR